MFSLGSEIFFHSDDHVVFSHRDVLKRRPHLINHACLYLQLLGTCTRYFPALYAHGRCHVRLNEWGC